MSYAKSQPAIEALHELEKPAVKDASLSFAESSNVRTAVWAVEKYGAQLLINKVRSAYRAKPEYDDGGRPISLSELGGEGGAVMRNAQEDAQELAFAIKKDLDTGLMRIQRGYPLETVTVRGLEDTSTVIGSLERAVEIHPENLDPADQHFQAAARYMLDHMVAQRDGATESFLL